MSVALAMALGKAAFAGGKFIKGKMESKNAGGPTVVDPTKTALINTMQRERRALKTGTSDEGARDSADKNYKNLLTRSIKGGKRDLGDYSKLRAQQEMAITEATSNERLGLLKDITSETTDVANVKRDLVEVAATRKRLKGEAKQQTGGKNFMTQIPRIVGLLKGSGGGNSK